MDAGNMLKPALARGELHCVGATTLDEYRKYIEKDAARWSAAFRRCWWASRRWNPPSPSCAVCRRNYEVHHGVDITDPAIVAAGAVASLHHGPLPA